jgi:hypothetical protein
MLRAGSQALLLHNMVEQISESRGGHQQLSSLLHDELDTYIHHLQLLDGHGC